MALQARAPSADEGPRSYLEPTRIASLFSFETPRSDTDSLGRAELGRAEPHGEHAPLLPAQAPAASRYGAA